MLLPYVLLPLLALTPYFGSLGGGFVYDDWPLIADNAAHLGSLSAVPDYFLKGFWTNSGLGGTDPYQYRPVLLLWNSALYAIAGLDPELWRLANAALHAINAVLLALLIGRMMPQSTAFMPITAAAVFAAHPALAHSVAWISGVSDVLLATIFISALLFYERARASGNVATFIGAICCCILAALTKETGITLPALFLAYDLCRKSRRKLPPIGWYGALLLTIAAYFGLRAAVLGGALEGGEGITHLNAAHLARFADYGISYLRFLVLPWPLPLYVEHPGFTVTTAAGLAIAAAAVVAMLWAATRSWQPRFGLIWIALTISPVLLIAFRDIGTFNMRYLYLPVVGLAIMIAAGLPPLARLWKPAPYVLAVPLVAIAALLAQAEARSWKNQVTWAERVIENNPGTQKGYWHLARYYLRIGDRPSAIQAYEHALRSTVDDSTVLLFTEDLMEIYIADRRFDDIVRIYRNLSQHKGYESIGHVGVGNGYWAMGQLDQALAAYRQALVFDPDSFDALYGHGRINEMLGNHDEARISFERMIQVARRQKLKPNQQRALDYARGFLKKNFPH